MNDLDRSLRRARAVLAVSAWILLAVIVAGLVLTLPGIAERTDLVITGETVLSVVAYPAVFGAWIGGVWHWMRHRRSQGAQRWIIGTLLVLGTFVGGFFYYFLYVHWLPSEDRAHAHDHSR